MSRYILLRYSALPSLSRELAIQGKVRASNFVFAFNAWKPMYICNSPVFFLIDNTGLLYGDTLGLMQPFASISLT